MATSNTIGWGVRFFWRGMDLLRKLVSMVFSVSKHLVAGAVDVVGFTVLCSAVYLLLLVIALFKDEGIGSPLLLILVPLGSFAVSLACVVFFLFPAFLRCRYRS
jgi:hypothetical protein